MDGSLEAGLSVLFVLFVAGSLALASDVWGGHGGGDGGTGYDGRSGEGFGDGGDGGDGGD